MGSMHWTAEESRYLKAIFSWQDRFDDEQDSGMRARGAAAASTASVGDMRVLVMGAPGVGKTALLTRFCGDAFTDEPDGRFTRGGGRRAVRIDKRLYNMDVLEMPSQHLVKGIAQSPAAMMLEQAVAITDAAIVVYDVCSPASFQHASRLYEQLLGGRSCEEQERKGQIDPGTSLRLKKQPKQRSMRFRSYKKQEPAITASHDGRLFKEPHRPRPLALVLVGNKSDVDDSARRVAWADGSKAAGPSVFFEASAKENEHVDDVFVQIGREILSQRADADRAQERAEMASKEGKEGVGGESSSASSSKALSVRETKKQTPRRPFILRVLGLSFGRRLQTAVA